jgi:DNA mismatch endonuclease (patch repair protein)
MALVRSKISGWRLHAVDLPGKPDLFFQRKKLAVFVDGCFWHGCPRCGHVPKTRAKFWRAKIQRNKLRHIFVARQLREKGIRVVRIWEHSLRNKSGLQNIISDMRIYHAIKASQKIGVQYEYQKTA